MSITFTGKCTIGINEKSILESGGILPLLENNGVKTLKNMAYTINVISSKPNPRDRETKYGKIRMRDSMLFDTHRFQGDVELADFNKEMRVFGVPLDRMPRELSFVCPISKHIFGILKKGKRIARVSSIDGKNVVDSFSRDEIMKIFNESVFTKIGGMFCEIIRIKEKDRVDFDCNPITEEKGDE